MAVEWSASWHADPILGDTRWGTEIVNLNGSPTDQILGKASSRFAAVYVIGKARGAYPGRSRILKRPDAPREAARERLSITRGSGAGPHVRPSHSFRSL